MLIEMIKVYRCRTSEWAPILGSFHNNEFKNCLIFLYSFSNKRIANTLYSPKSKTSGRIFNYCISEILWSKIKSHRKFWWKSLGNAYSFKCWCASVALTRKPNLTKTSCWYFAKFTIGSPVNDFRNGSTVVTAPFPVLSFLPMHIASLYPFTIHPHPYLPPCKLDIICTYPQICYWKGVGYLPASLHRPSYFTERQSSTLADTVSFCLLPCRCRRSNNVTVAFLQGWVFF